MVRKQIAEHTFLFLGIIKWVFWATLVGVVVGTGTSLFLELLDWSISLGENSGYLLFLLPAGLFLSSLIIKYLAPDAKGHGTEKVIEAVHKRYGKIKAIVIPVKLVATVITLASGGSAGKEGPSAQIGAGLSSVMADIFRFGKLDRRKLVICGISAGFAAVFGTPIAGAIFGVEVLFVGNILYSVLLPSFIAGIVSYQIAIAMGIQYSYHPFDFTPVFSQSFFLEVILAGIFFGICSAILIETMKYTDRLSSKIKIWEPLKGLIGGGVLVIIALIFSTKYLGLGLNTIDNVLVGENVEWYSFLVKTAATSITLSFGGSGGVVTPIFFIGSTAGAFYADVMGLNVATFAAIGLVAILSGSANTPIAASIMSVELFGPEIAPYATLACVVSFLMTGSRSVYPSQILSINKSPAVTSQIGKDMEHVETRFHPGSKRQMIKFLRLTKKVASVETYDIRRITRKKGRWKYLTKEGYMKSGNNSNLKGSEKGSGDKNSPDKDSSKNRKGLL